MTKGLLKLVYTIEIIQCVEVCREFEFKIKQKLVFFYMSRSKFIIFFMVYVVIY